MMLTHLFAKIPDRIHPLALRYMRRALLLLLLSLPLGAFAQERHRLAGFVQISGEPLISYFLDLTINGTEITGYSITDYKGGNRLKAAVVGKLSPASVMFIEEVGSLDGDRSPFQDYCYFTGHLKLTVANGKKRWSGPFESKKTDKTPCGDGLMTIIDDAPPLDPIKTPTPKPVAVPRPMRVVDTTKPKPAPAKPKPVVAPPVKDTVKFLPPKPAPPPPVIIKVPPKAAPTINDSCQRVYEWHSDKVVFDISDGWTIDGDVVSVTVAGHTMLDHVKLSDVKQRHTFTLGPGVNTFLLSLWEEGADPPNTPAITFYDGDKIYPLDISGDYGQIVRVCFIRK